MGLPEEPSLYPHMARQSTGVLKAPAHEEHCEEQLFLSLLINDGRVIPSGPVETIHNKQEQREQEEKRKQEQRRHQVAAAPASRQKSMFIGTYSVTSKVEELARQEQKEQQKRQQEGQSKRPFTLPPTSPRIAGDTPASRSAGPAAGHGQYNALVYNAERGGGSEGECDPVRPPRPIRQCDARRRKTELIEKANADMEQARAALQAGDVQGSLKLRDHASQALEEAEKIERQIRENGTRSDNGMYGGNR